MKIKIDNVGRSTFNVTLTRRGGNGVQFQLSAKQMMDLADALNDYLDDPTDADDEKLWVKTRK